MLLTFRSAMLLTCRCKDVFYVIESTCQIRLSLEMLLGQPGKFRMNIIPVTSRDQSNFSETLVFLFKLGLGN